MRTTPTKLFPLILIGLVTLPRLATDLYLPSLTDIALVFQTTEAKTKMTLTSFLFGSSVSMILSGIFVDIIGKKRVMLIALCVFILATLLSTMAASIETLVVGRFLQALGGTSGTLIARIWTKDYFSKQDQVIMLANLSLSMALCPLVMPLLGGVLQYYYGWHAIFYALEIVACCLFLACAISIKEPHITKTRFSAKTLFKNYYLLLTHKQFLAYSLAIGLAWCNYSAYTLESSFIFQSLLGANAIQYGLLMAIPVIGYISGIQCSKKFVPLLGWDQLIFIASWIYLAGGALMIILLSCLSLNIFRIIFPMVIVMWGVGIIIPCSQGAVMQPFPDIPGTVTGLFFFIQMLLGGLSGLILQQSTYQSALPLATMVLFSSFLLMLSQCRMSLNFT